MTAETGTAQITFLSPEELTAHVIGIFSKRYECEAAKTEPFLDLILGMPNRQDRLAVIEKMMAFADFPPDPDQPIVTGHTNSCKSRGADLGLEAVFKAVLEMDSLDTRAPEDVLETDGPEQFFAFVLNNIEVMTGSESTPGVGRMSALGFLSTVLDAGSVHLSAPEAPAGVTPLDLMRTIRRYPDEWRRFDALVGTEAGRETYVRYVLESDFDSELKLALLTLLVLEQAQDGTPLSGAVTMGGLPF